MKKILLFVTLAVILLLAFLMNRYWVAPEVPFHALELEDLDGRPFHLAEQEGKVLLINFFATWCKPCIAEMPDIDKAARQLPEAGYLFLAISDESPEKLKRFAEKNDYGFRILRLKSSLKAIDIYSIPTTYLLSPTGEVVLRKVGAYDWDSADMMATYRQLAPGS